jgi:iron(III)-salmochelin esterase
MRSATLGWLARLLVAVLFLSVICLLAGCPGTGDRPSTASEVSRTAGEDPTGPPVRQVYPASRQQDRATVDRSVPVSPRSTKTDLPGADPPRLRVLPPPPSESSAGPGVKKPAGVTAEKISGYETPAEYLSIPSGNHPSATVVVMLPADYEEHPKKKYPLVIAFGGAGECAKSPRLGALAWMHYYRTDEAVRALQHGRLESRDFRGLVTDKQLADFNRSLKRHPYQGVILACPSSPLLSPQAKLEFPEYEAFIIKELIPELEKRYRVAEDQIGVDGVSMGGARSMYYGFKYPEIFSSIGSVQGAFGPYLDIYRDLVKRNLDAIRTRSIQLVTSDGDVMQSSVRQMQKLLQAEGIRHRYLQLTGPHDYIFNQGPGALALLVFHDRALSTGRSGSGR